MLRYLVEDGEAEGIVLGVIDPDGATRIVSYGSPGASGTPLGPASVFEIASITKTFTATLLADMEAPGEVDLDDPVSRYLPSGVTVPALGGNEITLLDLATHTSGLSDLVLARALAARGISNPFTVPVDILYAVISDYDLPREPGAAIEYSNFGFALLGLALAETGGAPLRELVAERILEPVGMVRTGYDDAEQVSGHYGGEPVPSTASSVALDGAGGLRSSMEDMLRYLAANLGPPETDLQRAMRTAHMARRPIGEGSGKVGLAWRTITLNGRRLVEHGGDINGFAAQIAFDPERQVGAVILTNSREYDTNLLTDLVVHDPIVASESVAPGRDVLEGRTGTYLVAGLPMFIRLEDEGFLTVQPAQSARMRLYAESDTLFFTKREEWRFAFPSNDDASPDLLMYVDGRAREGTRIDLQPPPPTVVAGNVGLPIDRGAVDPYLGVYDVPLGQDTLTLSVYWPPPPRTSRVSSLVSRASATSSPASSSSRSPVILASASVPEAAIAPPSAKAPTSTAVICHNGAFGVAKLDSSPLPLPVNSMRRCSSVMRARTVPCSVKCQTREICGGRRPTMHRTPPYRVPKLGRPAFSRGSCRANPVCVCSQNERCESTSSGSAFGRRRFETGTASRA